MTASHTSSRNPDRHHRRLAIPLILCLMAAGCGSARSSHPTDKEQIRDVATRAYSALASDHPEAVCQLAVNEKSCLQGVITAKALRISVKALIPSDWRSTIQRAPIYLNASHTAASMKIMRGQTDIFQKVSGHWLIDQSQ